MTPPPGFIRLVWSKHLTIYIRETLSIGESGGVWHIMCERCAQAAMFVNLFMLLQRPETGESSAGCYGICEIGRFWLCEKTAIEPQDMDILRHTR